MQHASTKEAVCSVTVDAKRGEQQKNRTVQQSTNPEQKETMAAQATGEANVRGATRWIGARADRKRKGKGLFLGHWKCSHSFTQSFSSAKYFFVVSETAGKKGRNGEQSA
jgi:hypothetical protein